ncbi:conjugal transfer protein TraF [Bathymodiolus thermophilus thioautotrophic gill symbiont]|uniref:Conjugal transfer protein TraF n=1 Tax=Bathymodiolus thermophilus thioautotrophic gill symbiont TaxID=2360 RepID=A0A1J5TXW2_9GAMM|nr:conjugal transfer protein TraF [Bathymodiolus thermophilus thioautotrophic gill symbiont]AYQ57057.1 hypothetical protein MS2017_1369 [Bathymodiolus thermophilus thioautotrophic gill symbiont]OIR25640.1 hypothetical protein BGC33_13780 [Bathymodiolus thermophilus thioautotrophic gill symbiont]
MKNYFNINIILLLLASPLLASDIEKNIGKGYWNYEVAPKEAKEKKLNSLPPAPPAPALLPKSKVLMKLHPKQLQVLIKKWRNHAIHTLNAADVSEYLRIQDVGRKKSAAYAAVVGFVTQTNPNLSLADEVPITNTGKQAQFNTRKRTMDDYLQKSTHQYGLLYFSSKTCEYCRLQDGVLKQFLSVFNFDIKIIELSQNPSLAQRFNIKQTPSILIVKRNSDKYLPVTFGATSLPALTENIYRAIRYIQKEITPTQFFTNQSDIGTGLDPNNTQ